MKNLLSLLSFAALTVGLLASCSKIDERISNLEKRIDGIESTSIASVQQQIDGIKASITKLEAADVTISGQIDELKATADAHQTLIDVLKEADKALGQRDKEFEERIAALEGQVAAINDQINALKEADKPLGQKNEELEGRIATLEGLVAAISDQINALGQKDEGLEGRIATLEGLVAAINDQINALKEADKALGQKNEELEGRIATLEGLVAAISDQINALKEADKAFGQKDEELEARIATLEGQVTTIKGQIATLEDADKAINLRIDTLKTYVDTEIGKTKDWVEETFATLEQYQQTADDLAALSVTVTGISTTLTGIQTSISGLDTRIDSLDTALQGRITTAKTELEGKITSLKTELEGKIATAISASETSITTWINELLEGYYTIAQIDAKIDALNTAIDTAKNTAKERIDSVATELTTLKTAVDTAKANIRTEYKNAIDVAINKLDGEIRGALLDSIAAVNNRIASEVETLNTAISALNERITTCETYIEKLRNRIQSISFVPQYSDGKATCTVRETAIGLCIPVEEPTFYFEIQPSSLTSALVSSPSSLKMRYVSTITRAATPAPYIQELKITGVKKLNGLLAVTCSTDKLSQNVFSGESSVNVSLAVNDGEKQISSPFVELVMMRSPTILFNDPEFKAACVSKYDSDGDGEISISEGDAVTAMDMSDVSVTSAEGIEMFRNLTAVNFSENSKLKTLNLSYNKPMASLNVSGCSSLETLSLDESLLEHITCDFTLGHVLTLNGRRGVICDVTTEGYRKMLLLQVGRGYWDTSANPVSCSATDQYDGMANTNKILAASNTCDGAKWSRSFGVKYYMPAIGEIWKVYSSSSDIFRIVDKGSMELNVFVASSTEKDNDEYYKTTLSAGSGNSFSGDKGEYQVNFWAMRLL